jgi:hypothetical protein
VFSVSGVHPDVKIRVLRAVFPTLMSPRHSRDIVNTVRLRCAVPQESSWFSITLASRCFDGFLSLVTWNSVADSGRWACLVTQKVKAHGGSDFEERRCTVNLFAINASTSEYAANRLLQRSRCEFDESALNCFSAEGMSRTELNSRKARFCHPVITHQGPLVPELRAVFAASQLCSCHLLNVVASALTIPINRVF